jgi:hypothetical protein
MGMEGRMGLARTPRAVSAGEMVFQMSQAKGAVLDMEGSGCRLSCRVLADAKSQREAMMASKSERIRDDQKDKNED